MDQASAGVAEVEDAGKIEDDGVDQDDEICRGRIPGDEGRNDNPLQPVGELSASRFSYEGSQIAGVCGRELGFWKSADPRGGIGEEMFPAVDEKDSAVEKTRSVSGVRQGFFEKTPREQFAGPGNSHVGQRNSQAIGEDDLGAGEFQEHVSRACGLSIPLGCRAFDSETR